MIPFAINALFKLLDVNLFNIRTVEELISGYNDPILEWGKLFMPDMIKDSVFSLLNGVFNLIRLIEFINIFNH
jgi:hypothetical protein